MQGPNDVESLNNTYLASLAFFLVSLSGLELRPRSSRSPRPRSRPLLLSCGDGDRDSERVFLLELLFLFLSTWRRQGR